jgi:hypothetical protein
MINLEKRIIFIANPKSGSDTLRTYLKKYGFQSEKTFLNEDSFVKLCKEKISSPQIFRETTAEDQREHISCLLYKEYLNRYTDYDWDDFFIFSTIRNPWARYASAYKYVGRHRDYLYKGSFSKYVENPTFKHVRPFEFMFKDEAQELLCHNFIDMKDINKEVPKLLEGFDFENPPPIPYTNTSKYSAPYTTLYDENSQKIVGEKCGEVIRKFKYKFGE